MKIIGGHDYYDGAGYGVDETIIFLRKMVEHADHPFELPAPYSGSHNFPTLHFFYIFCGGEVFPGVREAASYGFDMNGERISWPESVDDEYHYDFEAALAAMKRVSKSRSSGADSILNIRPLQILERHFKAPTPKAWKDWIIENRVITGQLEAPGRCGLNDRCVEANIATLKDVKFFKAMDPATTHMRISNFIGGVLPHGTATVEIDNTSKIRKAGFDTQTSFRMSKGTKKPRRSKG